MTDTITLGILAQKTTAELAEIYNMIPGVRPVTRLSDPSTGRKRIELALERIEMKLARTKGQPDLIRIVPVGAATALTTGGGLRRIVLLTDKNPKRGASATRFALYRSGMTQSEYIDAAMKTGVSRQKARKDIYYDRDAGFIRIEE